MRQEHEGRDEQQAGAQQHKEGGGTRAFHTLQVADYHHVDGEEDIADGEQRESLGADMPGRRTGLQEERHHWRGAEDAAEGHQQSENKSHDKG